MRLIQEAGFAGVCIEGDWPDTFALHSYVTGAADPSQTLDDAFEPLKSRFPVWMWRNEPTREFIRALRGRNEPLPQDARAAVFGLDVYSMHASMAAVKAYLKKVDPPAAEAVGALYACFDAFGEDPQLYGRVAALGRHKDGCRAAAVAALRQVAAKTAEYAARDGMPARDAAFSAEMNARCVVDAEAYYRAMFDWNESSWNVRDRHFDDVLWRVRQHLRETRGSDKVVVWAHNSHLGDARHTKTGAAKPGGNAELNLGQLARESGGAAVINVGQFTHRGTVTASDDWGEAHATKAVRPALPGSYEELLHAASLRAGRPTFALDLRDRGVRDALAPPVSPRLERAIGVIYRPQTERQSHYFAADLPRQFDICVWHDVTQAVQPLDVSEPHTPEPEAFPTGL